MSLSAPRSPHDGRPLATSVTPIFTVELGGPGAHRPEALPGQVPHVEGALGVRPPDAGRVCEQEQLRAVPGKAVFLDHNRLPAPGRDQVGAANQQLLRPRERIDLIQIGIAGSVLLDGRVRLAVLHPGYVHEIARVLARAPNRMDRERRRLNALGGQGLDERDDGADGEEPANRGWNHDGPRGEVGGAPNLPAGADRGGLDRRTVWEHVSRKFPLQSLGWCTLAMPNSLDCILNTGTPALTD